MKTEKQIRNMLKELKKVCGNVLPINKQKCPLNMGGFCVDCKNKVRKILRWVLKG